MNILTIWLTYIHKNLPSEARFRTLDIERYREIFEELRPTCEKIKIPEFYCEGVDLGQIGDELKSHYIELYLDNAGYKQPHEYILTSIYLNKIRKKEQLFFYFTSEYSNWAMKRIVSISPNCEEIYRNDFKDVYTLSWKDYSEGKYQKASKNKAPVFKRNTLTLV